MSVGIGLVIVWLAGVGLIVLCARRPNAGRFTLGLLFLACSLGINGAFAAFAPAAGLRGIAHPAPLPVYRDTVEAVVRLFAGREVAFFALLMAYELAVALLYLAGGRATKAGIIGGALFNAAILLVFPLYTTMNVTLVVAQLLLLRHDFAPAFATRRARGPASYRPARTPAHR